MTHQPPKPRSIAEALDELRDRLAEEKYSAYGGYEPNAKCFKEGFDSATKLFAPLVEALARYRGVNAVLERHFYPPCSNVDKVEILYRPFADEALAKPHAALGEGNK